ncbi:MAG TPA: hypothetical protein VGD26_12635 [Chitinophagaceae bacterium]
MRIDEFGLVVLEQNPEASYPNDGGFHGNRGDSCAETGRLFHLLRFLEREAPDVRKVYEHLRTAKGFLRHPLCKWREDDQSSDQMKPLYLAVTSWGFHDLKLDIEHYLQKNKKFGIFWTTGNGDPINASFWACIKRANNQQTSFHDLAHYLQAVAMERLPYRWNDEKKWFERMEGSSADYLNFLHAIIQAEYAGHTANSLKALKLVSPVKLLRKIMDYYRPEPNCSWVIDLYSSAISKLYTKADLTLP